MTRGSTPRQTFELIRRIYSDLSSRLTNGGKVITLTHAIISLDPYAARRGALRDFDLNAQPGLHSLPRTPGSSSSRSGKSPARPSRDSTQRGRRQPLATAPCGWHLREGR